MLFLKQRFLLSRGKNANTKWFCQVQEITRLRTGILFELIDWDNAIDRKTKDWLGRINGMSTSQSNTRFGTHGSTAFNNFACNFWRQCIYWPTQYCNSQNWCSTHGIDITYCICRCYFSKLICIINDWHEEICCTNKCCSITHVIYCGIISRAISNDEISRM